MDEQPPTHAELAAENERLTALNRALLDRVSESEFARQGRPTKPARKGPTPPPGLTEGLEVANRLRAAVGPIPRDVDDASRATLLDWWSLRSGWTPLPHDPACAGREPSYEAPEGRRHDRAACRRRLTQHLSPRWRILTLGETLALGVLIGCDQQPNYPIDDAAMMVLEARPPLDLGRFAGLGAALAAAWTARRADPAALAGTWLSRIRRCVLQRPERAYPDPAMPYRLVVPLCGHLLLDRSQQWCDPLRNRLACPEHNAAVTKFQGARFPRVLRNAQPLDTTPPENRQA